MNHEHSDQDPTEFWEEFYSGDHPWTGRVNALLAAELEERPLDAASALDLGCGSGADAVWLAERGWQVTGTDIAESALSRAREAAAQAGVQVRFVRASLPEEFPEGSWDLVTASYLHSPTALSRTEVLRRALDALAPGGTLLVVSHERGPSWKEGHPAELPSLAQVLADVEVPGFTVVHAVVHETEVVSPEGEKGTKSDTVVRVRRVAEDPAPAPAP